MHLAVLARAHSGVFHVMWEGPNGLQIPAFEMWSPGMTKPQAEQYWADFELPGHEAERAQCQALINAKLSLAKLQAERTAKARPSSVMSMLQGLTSGGKCRLAPFMALAPAASTVTVGPSSLIFTAKGIPAMDLRSLMMPTPRIDPGSVPLTTATSAVDLAQSLVMEEDGWWCDEVKVSLKRKSPGWEPEIIPPKFKAAKPSLPLDLRTGTDEEGPKQPVEPPSSEFLYHRYLEARHREMDPQGPSQAWLDAGHPRSPASTSSEKKEEPPDLRGWKPAASEAHPFEEAWLDEHPAEHHEWPNWKHHEWPKKAKPDEWPKEAKPDERRKEWPEEAKPDERPDDEAESYWKWPDTGGYGSKWADNVWPDTGGFPGPPDGPPVVQGSWPTTGAVETWSDQDKLAKKPAKILVPGVWDDPKNFFSRADFFSAPSRAEMPEEQKKKDWRQWKDSHKYPAKCGSCHFKTYMGRGFCKRDDCPSRASWLKRLGPK